MPTATDSAVFIRWERMEVTPDPISGHYNVHTLVTINVAGELVSTFVTSASLTIADIIDDRDTAMELKRQDYVSA